MTHQHSGPTSAHCPACNPPENEALKVLRIISNEKLLRTFAALTHRMHVADRHADRAEQAANLRLQRDYVQSEILRRME